MNVVVMTTKGYKMEHLINDLTIETYESTNDVDTLKNIIKYLKNRLVESEEESSHYEECMTDANKDLEHYMDAISDIRGITTTLP